MKYCRKLNCHFFTRNACSKSPCKLTETNSFHTKRVLRSTEIILAPQLQPCSASEETVEFPQPESHALSETMSRDKIVLSFHETLLRESDVDILRNPKWLNDTLISFYFEYLETVRFKANTSILFVSPEVTQCIKVTSPAELSIFLDPLYAAQKAFIFFALNDNERTDCSGGSHWSLLVFSRPERALFHFDSHAGSNYVQARELSAKLLKYFQMPGGGGVVEPETLQQTNGYDCGVHVLCNTELVSEHVDHCNRIRGCGLLDKWKVLHKRTELLELIYDLKEEQ